MAVCSSQREGRRAEGQVPVAPSDFSIVGSDGRQGTFSCPQPQEPRTVPQNQLCPRQMAPTRPPTHLYIDLVPHSMQDRGTQDRPAVVSPSGSLGGEQADIPRGLGPLACPEHPGRLPAARPCRIEPQSIPNPQRESRPQTLDLLSLRPQASQSTSLCLSCFICTMGIRVSPLC